MNIETLVVTVDQHDYTLASHMHIQTTAVIGNQADHEREETTLVDGHPVLWLTDTARGVGRNRNKVLDRATADICVWADDDMRFVDGYPQIVERAIEENPDADVLVCNLLSSHNTRYTHTRVRRIHRYNYARYGAARLVIRRESIVNAGIRFSHQFGGGARYGSGEDTLFLHDCLKKGLKVVAVPYALATIETNTASTWFRGYTEVYFRDKGALYACLYPRAAVFCCLRHLWKHRRRFRGVLSWRKALWCMRDGIREFRHEEKDV